MGIYLKFQGLISTKSIFAPNCIAVFAVATNVMGLVQTKLDSFTPAKIYAKCKAEVALFTAKALAPLQNEPISASNSSILDHEIKSQD